MFLSQTFRRLARRVCPQCFSSPISTVDHMDLRESWEKRWSQPGYCPKWLGRGVSKEIIAAVEEGWFAPNCSVLDIGCGRGEVAHWFAQQGYVACGIDIASAVIEQARATFQDTDGRLTFLAVDICTEVPPGRPYSILIDRGCLHQIPKQSVENYVNNVMAVSAPDARMLLFIKAYRKPQQKIGDQAERKYWTDRIESIFAGSFTIERVADTYLDPYDGTRPDDALPGIVFWLCRD